MGGHGALVLCLRHPDLYRSVSAVAPIARPIECPRGQKAFVHLLGTTSDDQLRWRRWDAVTPGEWLPAEDACCGYCPVDLLEEHVQS